MTSDKVRRVQELRRSNAAVPRPGRRPPGPSAEEWASLAPADRHLAWALAQPPWRCTECFLSECTCTDCGCDHCGRDLPELTVVLAEAIARQRGEESDG